MSASIKEVAKRAGVSLGTVSNAFNRPDLLAPATLKKVTDAVAQLGYVPNASARNLRAGKTRVLGLIVPDLSNPFFTELAKGASDAALNAGYVMILCNTDESSEKEAQYLEVLAAQNVQGILITPARDTTKSLRAITNCGIALTLVDRLAIGVEACSVGVNDSQGGGMAFTHLHDLGHRKILLLTGAANIPQVGDREIGITKVIASLTSSERPKLKIHRLDMMSANSAEIGLTEYLSTNGLDFTAIICGNDLIAFGAIRALRNRELEVPTDVSVIGYDDIDFASSASVPLTSIAQPKYQIGFAAADLLIDECQNHVKHVHQRVEFQPQLIVRDSTRAILEGKK